VQLDGAGTDLSARVVIVGATNRPEVATLFHFIFNYRLALHILYMLYFNLPTLAIPSLPPFHLSFQFSSAILIFIYLPHLIPHISSSFKSNHLFLPR
jgi:hypothetical protein